MGTAATRRRARLRSRVRNNPAVAVVVFLAGVVDEASASATQFGHILRKSEFVKSTASGGSVRELFPLPQAAADNASMPSHVSRLGMMGLLKLVNASVRALNFLHCGKPILQQVLAPNHAQRHSLDNLVLRWWRMARHLSSLPHASLHAPGAYRRLVESKRANNATHLRAESIDLLDCCGHVDPSVFLPAEVQNIVNDPETLLMHESDNLTPHVRFSGSRAEYALLLRRECRAGKVVFATCCKNAANVFAIAKSTPGKQREVWDGSDLSKLTLPPPPPPWLSSPSNLGSLECSDDEPLRMSVRDGSCFFDQLKLPPRLREYVAKPFITVQELCDFKYKGGYIPEQAILSSEELKLSLVDGGHEGLTKDSILYPLSTCWPMGHSWSSMVAQYTMTGACQGAGVASECFLSDDNGLPPERSPCVSVATDDVILFERGSSSAVNSMSGVAPAFERLDAVWKGHGIQGKKSKQLDRVPDGTALGICLVQGKFLLPKATRVVDLLNGIACLFRHPFSSPRDFGCFFGLLQWVLLLNRPLLACCERVYSFIDASDNVERRVPAGVLSGLALIASLFSSLVVDLRCPWSPFISASDGAESYGYGGVRAKCDPTVTRNMASHAETFPHRFLPKDALLQGPDGTAEDDVFVMPVASWEFVSTFSVKSNKGFHASKLEIGALCLALKGIVRNCKYHRMRTLLLVDALAVLHACKKGRSSAKNLRHGIRVVASLALAAELKLHYGYIPSRWNPSDPDSRGKRRLARKFNKGKTAAATTLDMQCHRLSRALRHLRRTSMWSDTAGSCSWVSSCSSSCYGQPSM